MVWKFIVAIQTFDQINKKLFLKNKKSYGLK